MELIEHSDGWVQELETNVHGVRILTLRKAFVMAASGRSAGWYIAPFALKWTFGRAAADNRRYHVICDGEPIVFDSVAEAYQFLAGMLRLAAAPKPQLDFPALLTDVLWANRGQASSARFRFNARKS